MRARSLLFLIASAGLGCWSVPASAAAAAGPSVQIPRGGGTALRADLTDPAWQKAAKVQLA